MWCTRDLYARSAQAVNEQQRKRVRFRRWCLRLGLASSKRYSAPVYGIRPTPFRTVSPIQTKDFATLLPFKACPAVASNAAILLGTVRPAQVAVPADGDDIDEAHPVLQGDQLEVDTLHSRPDHVIGLEGVEVVLVEDLTRGLALQDSHAAQEHTDEGGREEQLVAGDAGDDGCIGALEVDVLLQDLEPRRRSRDEDG